MSLRYLIDENVDPLYKRQLLKKNLEIRVYSVGDVDEQTETQLLALGVRDSKLLPDNIILAQAEEIKQICRGQGTVLSYHPERYVAKLHFKTTEAILQG